MLTSRLFCCTSAGPYLQDRVGRLTFPRLLKLFYPATPDSDLADICRMAGYTEKEEATIITAEDMESLLMEVQTVGTNGVEWRVGWVLPAAGPADCSVLVLPNCPASRMTPGNIASKDDLTSCAWHGGGLVLQVFQVFAGRGGSRLDQDELVEALKLAGGHRDTCCEQLLPAFGK
jgi:hypothetical protein